MNKSIINKSSVANIGLRHHHSTAAFRIHANRWRLWARLLTIRFQRFRLRHIPIERIFFTLTQSFLALYHYNNAFIKNRISFSLQITRICTQNTHDDLRIPGAVRGIQGQQGSKNSILVRDGAQLATVERKSNGEHIQEALIKDNGNSTSNSLVQHFGKRYPIDFRQNSMILLDNPANDHERISKWRINSIISAPIVYRTFPSTANRINPRNQPLNVRQFKKENPVIRSRQEENGLNNIKMPNVTICPDHFRIESLGYIYRNNSNEIATIFQGDDVDPARPGSHFRFENEMQKYRNLSIQMVHRQQLFHEKDFKTENSSDTSVFTEKVQDTTFEYNAPLAMKSEYVSKIADQVIQQIDYRLKSWKERTGQI